MRTIASVVTAGLVAIGVPAAGGRTVVVGPGDSIQAAVDQAAPGDTVAVRPGTYHEAGRPCPTEPGSQWSFRLGTAYDETPVPDDQHRTPRIPDADRVWLAGGIGYRWSDRVCLDLGYAHLFALQVGSATPDPVTQHVVRGDYTAHADIVGIGLTYCLGWPPWGAPSSV